MKKLIVRIVIVLVVLVLLAVLALRLFLDGAVKRGVETVGPMVTKVPVKLEAVNLSLLSGAGTVRGLVVGNPEGYKTPSAIQVGTASLALQPRSLLSDKVVIRSVNLQGPEITFETDLKGNNLSKILANVQEATGGSATAPAESQEPEQGAQRKLQVDDFTISGAKLNVSVTALGGKSATVTLPEIHLTGLGQGPEGITAGELTKRVLVELEKVAAQAASGAVADLGKQAKEFTQGLTTNATGVIDQATKGLGGFLKKK